MEYEITIIAKVIEIGGNSLGITIPKNTREALEIKKGDPLQITITK